MLQRRCCERSSNDLLEPPDQCINAAFNMYIICVHPEFNQKLSGSADPTANMSTAQQEAQKYAMNNPDLVVRAAKQAI